MLKTILDSIFTEEITYENVQNEIQIDEIHGG